MMLSAQSKGLLYRADLRNIEEFADALTRIIHEGSTAEADPGMYSAFRSLGLLDVLSSTAGPSVALA